MRELPGRRGEARGATCTLLSFQKDGSSWSSNRAGAELSSSPPSDSIPASAAPAMEVEMGLRWPGSGQRGGRERGNGADGEKRDGGSGF